MIIENDERFQEGGENPIPSSTHKKYISHKGKMGSIKATHLLRWLLNKLQRWWKMSLLKRLKQPLKGRL